VIGGLFQLLAKLTGLISFLWKRKAAHNDKPETKDANARKAVENEILHDDEGAANARVSDALFRYRMRNNREAKNHKRGQRDQAS
jgi:hypothetical protein